VGVNYQDTFHHCFQAIVRGRAFEKPDFDQNLCVRGRMGQILKKFRANFGEFDPKSLILHSQKIRNSSLAQLVRAPDC
jgi:hypothetical protein